jgi:hypothetical protein
MDTLGKLRQASRPAVGRQKSPERDSSLRSAALRMTAWQTSIVTHADALFNSLA